MIIHSTNTIISNFYATLSSLFLVPYITNYNVLHVFDNLLYRQIDIVLRSLSTSGPLGYIVSPRLDNVASDTIIN